MNAPASPAGPAPARRRLPVALVALPLLAVAGWFGWQWLHGSRAVGTDNAYIKAERILLAAPLAGRVVEVAVAQNTAVKQGQLLFRLDHAPLELAVAEAQAELARLDNAASASRASVRSSTTGISAARETLDWALRDQARLQELASRKLVAAKDADDARHVVAEARSALARAQAAQQQAAAGLGGRENTPTQELPEYRAALARLEQARLDLQHADVRAPVDGVVANHDLQAGEYLAVGQTAMPLVAASPIWVEANFKETELTALRAGQPATLHVDAYPGVQWQARVESISPASGGEFSVLPAQNATGNWVKIVQRVPVRLMIMPDSLRQGPTLRSGMSAEVKVQLQPAATSVAGVH